MSKKFFEVFPVLEVNAEMKQLLTDMDVQRVVSNRKQTRLRVYLHGERLIHKRNIVQLEQNIKKQLFPSQELTVKIIEQYQLSAQYTPETLMDIYKDSILEELKEYSLLIYNIFRCAKICFDEGCMRLEMEDSLVVRERTEELLEILYKIIRDRCGLKVDIEPVFVQEKQKKKKQEEDILQFLPTGFQTAGASRQKEPDAAAGSLDGSAMAQADPTGPGRAKNTDKAQNAPADTDRSRKQSGLTRSGRNYPVKRSNNPDVIYGRDFEDEVTAIDQIAGEMGEVAVRGQVLTVDTRELRSGDKSIVIVTLTDFTDTIALKIFSKN